MPARDWWAVRKSPDLIAIAFIFFLFLTTPPAMADGERGNFYTWEWPADRKSEIRLLAKVSKLEKHSEGFFGINRSPSIAANLPDAQVMTGRLVDGDQKFTLILPKAEVANISANDYVALGILGNDICICIAKAPDGGNQAKQMEWLKNWECSKK